MEMDQPGGLRKQLAKIASRMFMVNGLDIPEHLLGGDEKEAAEEKPIPANAAARAFRMKVGG